MRISFRFMLASIVAAFLGGVGMTWLVVSSGETSPPLRPTQTSEANVIASGVAETMLGSTQILPPLPQHTSISVIRYTLEQGGRLNLTIDSPVMLIVESGQVTIDRAAGLDIQTTGFTGIDDAARTVRIQPGWSVYAESGGFGDTRNLQAGPATFLLVMFAADFVDGTPWNMATTELP